MGVHVLVLLLLIYVLWKYRRETDQDTSLTAEKRNIGLHLSLWRSLYLSFTRY